MTEEKNPVLKQYIGTKVLQAAPMTLGVYNDQRGWNIPKNENPLREGYVVYYADGYQSWSPKEVFEEAYRCIDGMKTIGYSVFPSTDLTISAVPDVDYPGGAHRYIFRNSLGFKNGKAEYVDSFQFVQFVQKNEDGTMVPGAQSEQLAYILLDRAIKLNARFPSEFNEQMITGLRLFLAACQDRVQDRIDRGVMGDLKR